MFKTIRNAFKVKELRGKILYTFMMLVVIRFGCQLPIPGIETSFFANWFAKQTTDVFGFFNAMTGGSFSSMSIFALSRTLLLPLSSSCLQLLFQNWKRCRRMVKKAERKFRNTPDIPQQDLHFWNQVPWQLVSDVRDFFWIIMHGT